MITVGRVWIWFSVACGVLMAAASLGGIFGAAYARETSLWAAEGIGQDIVNLLVAFPALLVTAGLAARGSVRGWLLWLGVLLYVVYSYVTYAFFIHFGPWFLAYVATLGLSAWSMAGGFLSVPLDDVALWFASHGKGRAMSVLLMIIGVMFAGLWLTEIGRALAAGAPPPGLAEVGLPVNPIHVLDLAFVLPAMIATSVLLQRRRIPGFVLAVPFAVFGILMAAALFSMVFVMRAKGYVVPGFVPAVMLVLVVVSIPVTYGFLREAKAEQTAPV